VCLGIALLFPSTADTWDSGEAVPDTARFGPGDWLPIVTLGLNGGDSVDRAVADPLLDKDAIVRFCSTSFFFLRRFEWTLLMDW